MLISITDPSSTTLHILFRINLNYVIFWFIVEICLFIFKYYHLSYATSAFGLEMAMIFMLCFNEFLRQFFGIRGNLTLNTIHLIISIIYGIFCIIGFIFFLALQSYIQRIEILLAAIALTLILLEIVLSIITIILKLRTKPVLTDAEKVARVKQAQLRFQLLNKTE